MRILTTVRLDLIDTFREVRAMTRFEFELVFANERRLGRSKLL